MLLVSGSKAYVYLITEDYSKSKGYLELICVHPKDPKAKLPFKAQMSALFGSRPDILIPNQILFP